MNDSGERWRLSRAVVLRELGAVFCAFLMAPFSVKAADSKRSDRVADKELNALVKGILFYGQSNAGPGGDAKPLLTAPVFPDRVMSFRSSRQVYGTQLFKPGSLKGIGSVQDHPKYPPLPATAMAYALGRSAQGSGSRYFIHTTWYGGQPLTAFMPGTTSWDDLLNVAHRMPQVLARKSMQGQISALVLVQGESGPPGRERYAHLLNEFLGRALPELKARASQTEMPVAILMQTNASNAQSATAMGVASAQWDVARSRPQDTVLAGPMYQFPLSDAVHQSTTGRMMLGDLLALVFEQRLEKHENFQPLHPVSAARVGDSIVISFKRPKGSQRLQWDRDWVPAVPDYGFQVIGPAGSVKIASVDITAASEVTIKVRRTPSSPLTVRYAMDQPVIAGWPPGRGQLMAPTARPTAFSEFGARIPPRVAHYAIRFELPVR